MTHLPGADLRVGDTIKVWWQPGRDTITGLYPYVGRLAHLFPAGALIAAFALNPNGMTIDKAGMYERVT